MAATDDWAGRGNNTSPARGGEAITKHDTNTLAKVSRGIWVGGEGDVTCLMADGQVLTFAGVAAGTLLPIAVQRVNATGTDATDMVAVY